MKDSKEIDVSNRMKLHKIALVGMPGSGKSTVGRSLARLMGWAFHDLDAFLVARWSMSISELFKVWGEDKFRFHERDALEQLLAQPASLVLATGGGTPVWHNQMNKLRESATVVWLDVDPDSIAQRLAQNTEPRPLLASPTTTTSAVSSQETLKRIQNLYEVRRSIYAQAHIHLKAIGPPEQLADELLTAIKKYTP
jgi:shikimate kinase